MIFNKEVIGVSGRIVSMQDICLSFDDHAVLDHAQISLYKGEVCSILGENGAGKSTLMKLLAGIYKQEKGKIYFEDKEVNFSSVAESKKYGIHMVFQDNLLIPAFTVYKNIFLGSEVCYEDTPIINDNYAKEKAREIMKFLEYEIDVERKMKTLSIAEQKIVEIARALIGNVKVLILDEISASFSSYEQNMLRRVLDKLKQQDIAIVYISHKIEEAMGLSDRLVIMRDGKTIDSKKLPNPSKNDMKGILESMAGEDYRNRYPKTKAQKGKVVMEINNVSNSKKTVKNVNMYIRSGEIVGVVGLQGAGKSSLAKLLGGAEKPSSGEIYYKDELLKNINQHTFVNKGIIYLSDDYKNNLIMNKDVEYNITFASLDKYKHRHLKLISKHECLGAAKDYISRLHIKDVTPTKKVRYLSRGTQQKVALAKWLSADAQVYVFDEPTMTLDTASKVEVYNIMNKIVQNGKSIFLISSDLREALGMCDRLYIMFNGSISAEMDSKEVDSVVSVLEYAAGTVKS